MGHTAEVDDDKPMSFQQTAEYLGIDAKQLYKLNDAGAPHYRVGKLTVYNREELDTWLKGPSH